MRRAALAAAALALAVAGGIAAIGIGAWAGWLREGNTVVLEEASAPPASTLRAAAATPLGPRFDPGAIYASRAGGVVTIYALFANHAGGDVTAQAQGSGFVVDGDGTIMTNSHVITTAGEGPARGPVEGATQVYVEFRDGDRVAGRIVGWDLFSDVGVIRVDPSDHVLAPLPLGDSAAVTVGEPVAAIGSPFGQTSSLSVGVVSATGRSIDSLTSGYDVPDAIQIDAPINRGNSGGPLFDARGEVIGINAQIRSESGNAEGVGFAIPINAARRALEQLLETGRVRYAWVGVKAQTLTSSIAHELGYAVERGAAIECVVPGSPAARAGLRGASRVVSVQGLEFAEGGDVVVAIDGQPIRSSADLSRVVSGRLFPGAEARFTVVRDGGRRELSVVPGDRARAGGDCSV